MSDDKEAYIKKLKELHARSINEKIFTYAELKYNKKTKEFSIWKMKKTVKHYVWFRKNDEWIGPMGRVVKISPGASFK